MFAVLRRCSFMGLALVILAAIALHLPINSAAAAPVDPYRPVYHFTPPKNFMNDPNGLIFHDGVYHMFYQYNPKENTAGNGSWGHATSTDLVHWREQPLAISTDANEDVWSGSVVFDRSNTSGFGTKKRPPMVAVYTSFQKSDGVQRQALAYSLDDGSTWTKYAQNPVIDIGSHDFRDPKVFWDAERHRWAMVVSLAAEKKISVYTSADLKHWDHQSDFGPAGAANAVWECPDLFPLTLRGKTKWVLTLSVSGKVQYFVGDFDGATFTSPDAAYTAPKPKTVLNDFEGTDYGSWTTTGTAFGAGPTTPGPDVTGRHGDKVVDSFGGSDSAKGTLTSPTFKIDQRYLNFLIGGGNHPYVPGGLDAPPAGDVFADFEGDTFGDGWTATGDFTGAGPSRSDLPGHVGDKVLDTCVGSCDPAQGTISSPEFTIKRKYINLLVGGGNHPLSGPNPTAVSLVIDGKVVATAQGKNSGEMDWTAWDVSASVGRSAHLVVTDQRTEDWGHLFIDHVVFSDKAATRWNANTSANLVVDGQIVRTATGQNGPGLDWASWDLTDLRGKSAQIQLVDNSVGGWGHMIADYFTLADQPAQSSAQRVRWIDHGNDYYAAVTFNDAPHDRRLMMGWMSNWDYARDTPTGNWRGQQSLVRELSLANIAGRPTLVQDPVTVRPIVKERSAVRSFTVKKGRRSIPQGGRALHIKTTIKAKSATSFGLDVGVEGAHRTRVGYDVKSQQLFVDRTASGQSDFSPTFAGRHSASLHLDKELALEIFVDSSSIEVFANGGRVSISDLIYPSQSSTKINAFAKGGSARVEKLSVERLGDAIHHR